MDQTRIKPKRRLRFQRPWDRGDHIFTVTSIALIVFLIIAGFGAWIFWQFGGSCGEAVSSVLKCSLTRWQKSETAIASCIARVKEYRS
jgi:hypothetical protein